jgi:hypothetical protein
MCSRQPLTFYYCTTSSVMGQNADISTLWAAINTESGQKWHCHWTLIKRLPEENHAPKSVFAQMMILSWNARIFWTMYPRLVFFSQIALRIDMNCRRFKVADLLQGLIKPSSATKTEGRDKILPTISWFVHVNLQVAGAMSTFFSVSFQFRQMSPKRPTRVVPQGATYLGSFNP